MKNALLRGLATLGFVGYIPYAPGTFGSAVGLLLLFAFTVTDTQLLLALTVLTPLAIFSAHEAEKALGKDSGKIVIDELCGYFIAVLFIPKTTAYLISAFVLFRLFDILKPPPVRTAERLVPGGAGIVLDDLLAGIYANVCIQIARFFL